MKIHFKKYKWEKIAIALAIVAIILVVISIVSARRYYTESLKPFSNSQAIVEVVIPNGYSLKDVSSLLDEKKLVRNKQTFEQYVRSNNASEEIKAGTYELSPSFSVPELVSILTNGKVVNKLITIIPGIRLDQLKRTLKNAGYSDKEIGKALDPASYPDHPALVDKPVEASLEGYIYPESFQRTTETPATEIIKKSLDEMQKRLTPQLRESYARQGLSVHRAVILASMVEREVSLVNDRPQVAQVFLSRLNKNMKLQSDATAKYGVVLDRKADELSYSQTLNYISSYNTYLRDGLPPGPISNVSVSSLKAVASPANTDWLYFVSGDDGVTHFSKTVEEHESLTAKYCKKLCN